MCVALDCSFVCAFRCCFFLLLFCIFLYIFPILGLSGWDVGYISVRAGVYIIMVKACLSRTRNYISSSSMLSHSLCVDRMETRRV